MDSYLAEVKSVIQEAQADAVSNAVAFVTAHERFASLGLSADNVKVLTDLFEEFKNTLSSKNKPKRKFKPSGYSLFGNERRAAIATEVKNAATAKGEVASQTDVMRAIGAAWSVLPQAEKDAYNDRAKAASGTDDEAPAPAAAPAVVAAPAKKGKATAAKAATDASASEGEVAVPAPAAKKAKASKK